MKCFRKAFKNPQNNYFKVIFLLHWECLSWHTYNKNNLLIFILFRMFLHFYGIKSYYFLQSHISLYLNTHKQKKNDVYYFHFNLLMLNYWMIRHRFVRQPWKNIGICVTVNNVVGDVPLIIVFNGILKYQQKRYLTNFLITYHFKWNLEDIL